MFRARGAKGRLNNVKKNALLEKDGFLTEDGGDGDGDAWDDGGDDDDDDWDDSRIGEK